MINSEKMTARQFATSLMRGEKKSFKLGYSAEAAAMTVASQRNYDDVRFKSLLSYCQGFVDGAAEDSSGYHMGGRISDATAKPSAAWCKTHQHFKWCQHNGGEKQKDGSWGAPSQEEV